MNILLNFDFLGTLCSIIMTLIILFFFERRFNNQQIHRQFNEKVELIVKKINALYHTSSFQGVPAKDEPISILSLDDDTAKKVVEIVMDMEGIILFMDVKDLSSEADKKIFDEILDDFYKYALNELTMKKLINLQCIFLTSAMEVCTAKEKE